MRLIYIGDHAINAERITRTTWINGEPIGYPGQDPRKKNCLLVWFGPGDFIILDPKESKDFWNYLVAESEDDR